MTEHCNLAHCIRHLIASLGTLLTTLTFSPGVIILAGRHVGGYLLGHRSRSAVAMVRGYCDADIANKIYKCREKRSEVYPTTFSL